MIDKTQIEHVIITGVGDQLNFPKSVLANLVLRYVRARGAELRPAERAVRFNKVLQRGRFEAIHAGGDDSRGHRCSCNTTGGTTRRVPRARC